MSCGDRSASCSAVGLEEDGSPANDVDCDWALDRTHKVPERGGGLGAQRKVVRSGCRG